MPIYEYRCRRCRETFETIERISRHDPKKPAPCPRCEGNDTERNWNRFTAELPRKSFRPARPLDL